MNASLATYATYNPSLVTWGKDHGLIRVCSVEPMARTITRKIHRLPKPNSWRAFGVALQRHPTTLHDIYFGRYYNPALLQKVNTLIARHGAPQVRSCNRVVRPTRSTWKQIAALAGCSTTLANYVFLGKRNNPALKLKIAALIEKHGRPGMREKRRAA